MNNYIENVQEYVSAMADSQLDGETFTRTVAELGARDELRDTWRTYHLVGEVLRTGRHHPCCDPDAFMARLRGRLASESAARPMQPEQALIGDAGPKVEAANEPVFRWKLVAGLASVAAAAVIGWHWIGAANSALPGTQLLALPQPPQSQPAAIAVDNLLPAQSGQLVPVTAQAARVIPVGSDETSAVMMRNLRLDAFLEAHRQAAGASQMPASFLRDATFEVSPR